MRFLSYTLGTDADVNTAPSAQTMAQIEELMQDANKAGVVVATGGVGPIAQAIRVSNVDGEITVTDGPFAEAKELVGGWALFDVRDQDEILHWTKRWVGIVGGTTTVRRTFGPEDFEGEAGADPNSLAGSKS